MQQGLLSYPPHVLQAYAGLQTSLWSYNSQIRSWEPVMEPWNTIIKLEANSTETVRCPMLLERRASSTRAIQNCCS